MQALALVLRMQIMPIKGAKIVATAAEAWEALWLKKLGASCSRNMASFSEDLLLFTYLHMAAAPELA